MSQGDRAEGIESFDVDSRGMGVDMERGEVRVLVLTEDNPLLSVAQSPRTGPRTEGSGRESAPFTFSGSHLFFRKSPVSGSHLLQGVTFSKKVAFSGKGTEPPPGRPVARGYFGFARHWPAPASAFGAVLTIAITLT
jgi:hypothetical protein